MSVRRYVGLDLSTKTGFVALDDQGNALRQKELTGVGDVDPLRMVTLIDEIMDHIRPEDVICIEGFGFASQQAVQNGGIGWGVRMALCRRGIKYYEVAPMSLKRFCGASVKRKDANGKEMKPKAVVAAGVYEHWGYTHSSDNVIDGYVLAQIAYALTVDPYERAMNYKGYQIEVVETILKPAADKKADKAEAKKKKKERAEAKAAGKPTVRKQRSNAREPDTAVLF